MLSKIRVKFVDAVLHSSSYFFSKAPWLREFLKSLGLRRNLEARKGQLSIGGETYQTNSGAFQDVFVQLIGKWHQHNTYLEIGSGHPEEGSNTSALEKLGWRGLSVEINAEMVHVFRNNRKNEVICQSALDLDYEKELSSRAFPRKMGYLQIDIEPPEQSLAALKKIPFDTYRFACITFEHDSYVSGKSVRNQSRQFLLARGYVLLVRDVEAAPMKPFEDWWVHPELVDVPKITYLSGRGQLPIKSEKSSASVC